MPKFRTDLASIPAFRPDKTLDDGARDRGVEDLAKLSFNEPPQGPFDPVIAAMAAGPRDFNRYPDTSRSALRRALAEHLSVAPDNLWCGAGSAELLLYVALVMGGPGTSAVFAHPSFFLYAKNTSLAGSEAIPVPVDDEFKHDLPAMRAAIRPDTTLVYVCNPNNPTGTHTGGEAMYEFIESVPERVLVLVDEAYYEYLEHDPKYRTALPLALERDNVVVTRTFSKIYSLAGLRVGYMIGKPGTLEAFHKMQTPFTVSNPAQTAALEALRHPDLVAERLRQNAAGLEAFYEALSARNIPHARSLTNFVYCHLGDDTQAILDGFMNRGIAISRQPTGWFRVNIGTPAEHDRFVAALDEVVGERVP